MELITFGETMVVFNPETSGPLCFVNRFSKSIGGAESNVAIALSRLGHHVGWFSRLGNDEFGRYIQTIIRGEGVDTSKIIFDEEKQTGILFKEQFMQNDAKVYYYRKDSAASTMTEEDINEAYIKQAKILHITGITLALSETARKAVFKAIEIAKGAGVLVSFDPNIRLKLWSIEEAKPVLLEVAKYADIILPGVDEAKLLIHEENPEAIAKYFHELGCQMVVVKLGKDGCFVSDSKEQHYSKGYFIPHLEDTVGAGDGFAAGFLSGYLRNMTIEDCAKRANAVGALATQVKGDIEGYPNETQVLQFMGHIHTIDR